ncbi:hypothetical protein BJV82DRAFT_661966 [Fennellomyces sp. T-0311]|nr:hypothetical protein BJV82DRAFT_661966 [Fennellomyces sp. T-0311]
MDKDVTTQNIRSNLGFWDDIAGTALSMFGIQIGIPFDTHYLHIVEPIIMLTPSSLVYTGSRYDFFADTWDEATLQTYNQFTNSFQSPDSVEELCQLATVARCGLGAAHFCLCMALRHPGTSNYDPAVQQRKCNEIYWTFCSFFALQEVIYDRTAERSGLGDILGDIKQQVADADADAINFSARMTAARSKTGAPTEPSEPRRGAPLVFEGEPYSPDRVAQFERMQAEEGSRVRRGIQNKT